MAKFHIGKNGMPASCKAVDRPCPLGGDEVHFDSWKEAYFSTQKGMQQQFGVLGGIRPEVRSERKDPGEILPPEEAYSVLKEAGFNPPTSVEILQEQKSDGLLISYVDENYTTHEVIMPKE